MTGALLGRARRTGARAPLVLVLGLALALPARAGDGGFEADGGPAPDAGVLDGGQPAITTAQLQQLARDWGCRDAPPPIDLGDAGWLFPPDRVSRTNCMLAGASTEAFRFRELADAGTVAQSNTLHMIISATAAILSLVDLYANNRTARKLPLWPP